MVHAVKSLLHEKIAAVRATCPIDPCSFIDPRGLHDERVIILPFPHRVAEPPWFGIFGEISPIRPYDSPYLAKLVQHYHANGRLKDLSRSQFVEVFARHPLGIAVEYWIICVRRENASNSTGRLRVVQRFPPQRRVG